jgi:hypothetical protein
VQSRTGGLADVLAVLLVVALAAAAFTFLIPRLSINLSGLNQLSGILPVLSPRRPVVEPTAAPVATPSATRAPTATPAPTPAPADRWAGSTVSVSQASPAQNTPETIVIKLRRDGQPAANVDVFATVDYRTTQERWPATGTVKTDSAGSAAITFNVGQATPGFQVQVHVFAQLDDQPQSWSTSFTPR